MSTVTQKIPNLFLGISQQADSRKFPGQVKDAVNTLPDFALGMLKRPGGKHVGSLVNATTTGRWFSIIRDEQEKYVAQYANNTFRVWSLIDGNPRPVNMGSNTGVPGTCVIADVESTLTTYRTAVENTKAALIGLHAAQSTYAETLAGRSVTQEGLFKVGYNYTPGKVDQYLVSGILRNAAGVYTVKNNNTVVAVSSTLPAGYTLGTEYTEEQPLIASEGYRVWQAIHEIAATHTAAQLTQAETAMNNAQTAYDNAVQAEATALGNYNTELGNCAITTVPQNAYLEGASPEDIEVLTLNDYTFVLNKNKTVAMAATTSATLPEEAHVVITVVANNVEYKVVLDGTVFTHASGTNANADQIVNGLKTAIDNGNAGYTVTVVGPGLHISKNTAFSIETRGSTAEGGLYAFQHDINTVSSLPSQARNGYKVRVVNSNDIDIDDMWLEFKTSSGGNFGIGTWEESVGPGVTTQLDPLTMPHQLRRLGNGTFSYEPVTWDDRIIGDDVTNPVPSFVGSTLNHMFLYRNRLGFLSNETVVMSRAGDLFNFFNTTALTATDDDPIDISASTAKPVTLNYVRPTAVGLMLFGTTEQFLLSTDSDIMSPKTAKINTLSSYECDASVEAVSVGTSTAFLSKTSLYTKVFNLNDVRNDTPPNTEELTYNIPELIPSTIDHFVASPALSILALGTVGSKTIYQYRFLQLNDRRVQSWYKWDLTGTLLDQFFDLSTYYAVVANGTNVEVVSMSLRQSSDEGFLTLPTGEKTDVYLDYWNVNPYRTYNSSADTTRVFLPYETVTGSKFSVVALGGFINSNNALSSQSVGAVLYPTVVSATGSDYVDINGDYRGRDLIIGYTYNMELELPKFYITSKEQGYVNSDLQSDLVLHRINVATGLSGPVTYKIDLTGIPTWENTVEVTEPGSYVLNNVNMSSGEVHTVPIYQRNKNVSIKIVGDTPFPVSLLDLTWEGKNNSRFYRRV